MSEEANSTFSMPTTSPIAAAHRGITSELYGGDAEMRLKQEIVLGIGGWRLLRALGLEPQVCHLNEGHAAFAVLERARCYMEDHKTSFDLAMAVTRAGNLFTTHTAVAAGFDRFDPGSCVNIYAITQKMSWRSPWTNCWRWDGRATAILRQTSTWPILLSVAAGRSMA